MQTIVQINIYRYLNGRFEYLLLKRADNNKDEMPTWQPVSKAVANGRTVDDTLKEAVIGQTGITGFKGLDAEIYSYEWYSHGERGRDMVFAGEVSPDTPVLPDLTLYSSFGWFLAPEARLKLKWDGNKQAIRELNARLEERQKTKDEAKDKERAEAAKHGIHDTHSETTGETIGRAGVGKDGKLDKSHIAPDHNPETSETSQAPQTSQRQPSKRLPDEEPPSQDEEERYLRGTHIFPL
jgi:hypothetical protein